MRTIIEDQTVSEAVDVARGRYPRLDDVFEALKWYLSRVPERNEALDDVNFIYRQDGDAGDHLPSILVVYTFDTNNVRLRFVDIRDALI